MTATPEKARLEELAKKRKKQTNTNSRPALTKKVKDSRPKSKNNPWQTKSYTGTKRRLNLRDDKSSSEDKEEALVLSMRHNFKTNTSDDNCEEFDTDLQYLFSLKVKFGSVVSVGKIMRTVVVANSGCAAHAPALHTAIRCLKTVTSALQYTFTMNGHMCFVATLKIKCYVQIAVRL